MTVAVLALQGAFAEHEQVLRKLNIPYIELRQKADLNQDFDGLILPGGESTVQGRLLKDLNMFEDLKQKITDGLPVLATCAGLILLAEKLEGSDTKHFGTMPITVKRNAYGRQLGSFFTNNEVKGLGVVPMTFIRAPYISETNEDVDTLAVVDKKIVGVRYGNQFGYSFHPELDDDTKIHELFLDAVSQYSKKKN